MNPDQLVLLITFLGYILVLLGIGLYFYLTGETRNLVEYMLADRDVGFFPMGISEAASVASGWTFLAWVGFGFATGLNGLIFSFFFLVMIGVMYIFVGQPFRRQSEKLNSITITDHLSAFFQDETAGVVIRVVGTISILVFFGTYVGSQLQSVGKTINTSFEVSPNLAIVLGGGVVVLYTVMGGFRASVWTDVVQAVLVMIAAIGLPIVALYEIGGIGSFLDKVGDIDPKLLTLSGTHSGWGLVKNVLYWLTFAFAVIGQPHSLMRFQAVSSEDDIPKAGIVAFVFQAIRMTLPLFIGLSARVIYESVGDPEIAGIQLLTDYFHPAVAGLLLAGVVSAIISTSDSMIIVAASDVTRVFERYISGDVRKSTLVVIGRVLIFVLVLSGVLIAVFSNETIFQIIEFAFTGLGVTFGIPLVFLLFWDRVTGAGVAACMFVGLGGAFLHNFYVLTDFYPIFIWPVCVVVLVLVSLVTE